MNPLCSRLILSLLALQSACLFTPELAAELETDFDCVIEPRATIEVGSAEEGILEEMLVRRGDLVHMGTPVARLESELEQYAAEAARLRAENLVEIDSQKEQVRFRLKEVERLRTMRKTWVRRRLPSGWRIGAPLPKSTWPSSPGSHSIRRKGSGLADFNRRPNRLTLS